MFPCPRSRLRIWSRETDSAIPSRVSLPTSTSKLNLVLTGFFSISAAASIYLCKPPYAIGSVSSFSGHAIAYRWRSLPRVRRHRASRPQRSSKRVLPWQVTMDQFICAALSNTHYWHEVGILKVPAYYVSKPIGFVAFKRGQSASRRGVKQKSPGGFCLEMIS